MFGGIESELTADYGKQQCEMIPLIKAKKLKSSDIKSLLDNITKTTCLERIQSFNKQSLVDQKQIANKLLNEMAEIGQFISTTLRFLPNENCSFNVSVMSLLEPHRTTACDYKVSFLVHK